MGYLVHTSGSFRLPADQERQVLTVLEVRLSAVQGRFHPDAPVDTLDDLARYAGARLTRDGDWLTVSTDREGDPTWDPQSAEFYAGLRGWVQEGEVVLIGQDGTRWSYVYSPAGLQQIGAPTYGPPRDLTPPAPASAPEPEAPTAGPDPGSVDPGSVDPWPIDPVQADPSPDAGPTPPPGYAPPPGYTPPQQPPQPRTLWDVPLERDRRNADRPPRTFAMALLLIAGVLGILAIAFLASGLG